MDKENFISIVDRGLIPIVPLFNYSKVPMIKWKDEANWITTKEYKFEDEFSNKKINGFSLICGEPSGIMVIDIDLNHGEVDGQKSFDNLIENLSKEDKEQILNTFTVKTPNGGKHLYFQYEKGLKSKANYVPGVDVRTDGGLIVLPNSKVNVDQEIRDYKILNDSDINKIPKSLFDKLISLIAPKTNNNISSNKPQIFSYKEGARNDNLFKEAIAIISKSSIRDIATVTSIVQGLNLYKCSPPLEENEVATIIASIIQRLHPSYCNEKGNVNGYLLAKHIIKSQPSYTKGNLWFMYDNAHGFYKYMEFKEVQRLFFEYAINDTDKTPVKSKNFAETLMLISEDAKEIHDEKRYINCLNGVVDIKKNELLKHDSKYKLQVQFNANLITDPKEWKDKFDKSEFKKFLYSTLDDGSIKTLQEAWGLMLSPHAREVQNCFIYKGEGSNGKSVTFDIQEALISEDKHICGIGLGDFGETFAISVAEGKHVNIVRDDELNGKTVSKAFKSMCCGEPITVNRKNKDLVRLGFNMTMFFGLNRMPSASDKSTGFFRRPIIIPFNNSFGTEKEVLEGTRDKIKDPLISDRIIQNELDIVFTWAYYGLNRVKSNKWKVTVSESAEKEMEEYRQEVDSAYAFFKEKVIIKKDTKVPVKDIYEVYYNWCNINHTVPMNNKHFGRQLSSFGIKSSVSNSIRYYLNIEINDLVQVNNNDEPFV